MAPEEKEAAWTRASSPASRETYVLRLYVTGVTPNSLRAISNITALCHERLAGRHDLRVIDIYQRPALATTEHIVAAPTLVKKSPLPLRRLIGDMGQREAVLRGLDLCPETE